MKRRREGAKSRFTAFVEALTSTGARRRILVIEDDADQHAHGRDPHRLDLEPWRGAGGLTVTVERIDGGKLLATCGTWSGGRFGPPARAIRDGHHDLELFEQSRPE